MEIITSAEALRARLADHRGIAFVPTMGNLHEGHLSLVRLAKQHSQTVVVSIFVNPLQFGKNEDLENYPRTLDADISKLTEVDASILFAPEVGILYPDYDPVTRETGQTMLVTPPPIANQLCGASRPGHFDGVATVVLKLFNLVRPDIAVFGKKDFQQLHIIRELVRQFNIPITIMAGETEREADGLAMSSRNGYLNAGQRIEAPRLYKTLQVAVRNIQQGNRDFAALERDTSAYLTQLGWIVDYIAIRSERTLLAPLPHESGLIALGAARLGQTRLIDNIQFRTD